MIEVVKDTRLAQLKALLTVLAKKIDTDPGARDMAQISRQYRETLKEIEDLEKIEDSRDEIAEILEGVELLPHHRDLASDGEPIE